MKIGSKEVTQEGKPYIIAEIGCNHNGDMDLAKRLIKEAQDCGCDAIKLQLISGPPEICTDEYLHDLDKGNVKLENVDTWKTPELGLNNIFEQVEKFSFYKKEHRELYQYCRDIGIDYGSTCVDNVGVDFLVEEKVDFIKISSMDAVNLELIQYAVSKDIPVMISLGMTNLGEIEDCINAIPDRYKPNVTLFHCTSIYPPTEDIVNLNFIKTLQAISGMNVGYSDHTLGFSIPLAAITLGATVIEKHFTMDKDMPGWDHKVSADPDDMRIICSESARIKASLGNGIKQVSEAEMEKRLKFRRSLTSLRPIKAGEVLKREDMVYKRPGTGISPHDIKQVVGRVFKRDVAFDQTITYEDLV